MIRRPPRSTLFPYTDALPIFNYDAPDIPAQASLLEMLDIVNERLLHDVDRKSTRLNSSHVEISYAVFCLKKKKEQYVAATKLKPDSVEAWNENATSFVLAELY